MIAVQLLFIFLLNLITVNSEICDVCKCLFLKDYSKEFEVKENFEIFGFSFHPDTIEEYDKNTSYPDFIEKYFYINCFKENEENRISDFKLPQIKVLEIFANLKNGKLQKMEYFPNDIKTQLTVLSLSNNFIQELEKSEVEKFNNLKMLNLSENKIEKIKKSTFTSLNSLEILDLSKNRISEVQDWSFYGTALTFLNLSENFIDHLSMDVFRGLNNLTYLDVSRNNLNKLSDSFGVNLPSLKLLFLQNNQLKQLPELPKNLKTLDISNNNLNELQLTHSNLEVLNLDNNHITSVGDTNFANLKVLTISHNNIILLKLSGTNQIIELDLSYNKLTQIPEIITSDKFPNLRELILDGNPIGNISFIRQLRPFENLKKISFSNCSLNKIFQNSFENVFSDKKFDCSSQNGLTLNFSHNIIIYVEKETFKNFQVCSVDFSNNKLKTFSEDVLPWREMSHINLQSNPWQCDCNIQWMLKKFLIFMYNSQPQLLFDLKCSTPHRYKNKMFAMWYNKTENVFCNSGPSSFYLDLPGGKTIQMWTASGIACIALGCIILGILIAIIVLLCKRPKSNMKKGKTKKFSNKGKPHYKSINNIKDSSRETFGNNIV